MELSDEQCGAFKQHLMVFYTGTSRLSSSLSQQLVDNLDGKAKNLERMQAMVPQAVDMLRQSDFKSFGKLLHETWTLKRALTSSISTAAIDRIYDDA